MAPKSHALALLALMLPTVALCAPVTLDSCEESEAGFEFVVNEATAEPTPVQAGKEVTVSIKADYTGERPIQEAQVNIQIVDSPISFDLGDLAKLKDLSICDLVECPVQTGPLEADLTFKVPSFAPEGDYKAQFTVTDVTEERNEVVLCVVAEIKVDNGNQVLNFFSGIFG